MIKLPLFLPTFSPLTSIFTILLSNPQYQAFGAACVNDMRHCLLFHVWLILLKNLQLLSTAAWFHSVCGLVVLHYVCVPHFIHSSIDEHLDNFYFLAVVKSITNIEVQMSLREGDCISCRYYVLSGNSELFWGIYILFFIMTAANCISTSSTCSSPSPWNIFL